MNNKTKKPLPSQPSAPKTAAQHNAQLGIPVGKHFFIPKQDPRHR